MYCVIGVDIAKPNSRDFSAISLMCKNCNTIIYRKTCKNEPPYFIFPAKCPKCGIEFKMWIEMTEGREVWYQTPERGIKKCSTMMKKKY